jgi:tRNA threonylcarbamoyladenosine biosynthesis protein TsaB
MNEDALILSVDTATPGGGVCVVRGRQVLASSSGDAALSHSNTLLRDIKRLLSSAGLSLNEIELFAAAIGPGSFTGLRIGLATVKGLAATLGRPCVGVPTLHAVARGAGPSEATVSLLPAGRGELFAQRFSVSAELAVTEEDSPGHLSPTTVIEKYGGIKNLIWTGAGALAQIELLRATAERLGFEFDEEGQRATGWRLSAVNSNIASQVAAIALARQVIDATDAEHLHALYVRPSDPELKHASN